MTQIVKKTGLGRESLYKALSADGLLPKLSLWSGHWKHFAINLGKTKDQELQLS
jgi:DNA-binding phage protein